MSSDSYFWTNLGLLQTVGAWTPYFGERNKPSIGKYSYEFYRLIMIIYLSLHTTAEVILLSFNLRALSLDELTISIAYSVQHILAIFKMYIVISQEKTILDLDMKTKKFPLYRENDPEFDQGIRNTIKVSNRIAAIYWFMVLNVLIFGTAAGAEVTKQNKHIMNEICTEKLNYYHSYLFDHNQYQLVYPTNETIFKDKTTPLLKVNFVETKLRTLNISVPQSHYVCTKPKRVFQSPVWMPFDAQKSPVYEIVFIFNSMAAFCLVLIILPSDLLIMSFMRYIQFQFLLIKTDLENLRSNSIKELMDGNDCEFLSPIDEDRLADIQIKKMEKIIEHQLEVYSYFEHANEVFTWSLFGQYFGSAIMICDVLYSMSAVVAEILSPNFFHMFCFYSGLIIQIYCNCYIGSQISTLSGDIGTFAYFSGWQNGGTSPKLRPYIMMIMYRSHRACKVTAGKFVGIDLPTFLNVFKASYSYYNLLVNDPRDRYK